MSLRTQLFNPGSALLAAAGSLCCAMAVADPQPRDEVPVTQGAKVSLADLDLATTKGMEAARARIHQKVRQLCSAVIEDLDIAHHPDFLICVDQTMAEAMRQLGQHAYVAAKEHP
jgi:UrcA family protein